MYHGRIEYPAPARPLTISPNPRLARERVSIAVDVSSEGVRAALSEQRVRDIVRVVCRREKVRDALISVAFVSNARIAQIEPRIPGSPRRD